MILQIKMILVNIFLVNLISGLLHCTLHIFSFWPKKLSKRDFIFAGFLSTLTFWGSENLLSVMLSFVFCMKSCFPKMKRLLYDQYLRQVTTALKESEYGLFLRSVTDHSFITLNNFWSFKHYILLDGYSFLRKHL